jgi:hypothetical protein
MRPPETATTAARPYCAFASRGEELPETTASQRPALATATATQKWFASRAKRLTVM